jgi:hypothetical protein
MNNNEESKLKIFKNLKLKNFIFINKALIIKNL